MTFRDQVRGPGEVSQSRRLRQSRRAGAGDTGCQASPPRRTACCQGFPHAHRPPSEPAPTASRPASGPHKASGGWRRWEGTRPSPSLTREGRPGGGGARKVQKIQPLSWEDGHPLVWPRSGEPAGPGPWQKFAQHLRDERGCLSVWPGFRCFLASGGGENISPCPGRPFTKAPFSSRPASSLLRICLCEHLLCAVSGHSWPKAWL